MLEISDKVKLMDIASRTQGNGQPDHVIAAYDAFEKRILEKDERPEKKKTKKSEPKTQTASSDKVEAPV